MGISLSTSQQDPIQIMFIPDFDSHPVQLADQLTHLVGGRFN